MNSYFIDSNRMKSYFINTNRMNKMSVYLTKN